MDVKLREVLPFSVSGLQVRTLNAAEQQPDTARIGPMWEQFFVEDVFDKIAHKQPDSFMYGVYSNYELLGELICLEKAFVGERRLA